MTPSTDAVQLVPSNPLEQGVARARTGEMSLPVFMRLLFDSEIVVPSASEPDAQGRGLQPLYFDKDGTTMMAVFSGLDRAAKFSDVAPYCLQLRGRALMRALAPDVGIVLNPTYDLGLEMLPAGIATALRDFA